jgi:hypothetical protein
MWPLTLFIHEYGYDKLFMTVSLYMFSFVLECGSAFSFKYFYNTNETFTASTH